MRICAVTMLSRVRLNVKGEFRYFTRRISDKHGDNDKMPEKDQNDVKSEKKVDSNTEKIQALLKAMMTAPKISDEEYREKFVTAPDRVKKAKEEAIDEDDKIEENLTKAAGEVAQALGGNVKQTEAELLSKVLGKINQTSTTLSDLLVGMKVDRSKDTDDLLSTQSRGQQVKRMVEKSSVQKKRFVERRAPAGQDKRIQDTTRRLPQVTTVNVFSGQPLGIFKAGEPNYGTKLTVWEQLKERELTLATAQPPANYFQKMIQWTEQGKIWKFPINNEQDLDEEQKVHFSEHIFIDSYLEGWCPKKGPVRHFMELVCVGLSKNAFYTAKEKKEHIMWYKQYFESKKDLLTEVGAWESSSTPESNIST